MTAKSNVISYTESLKQKMGIKGKTGRIRMKSELELMFNVGFLVWTNVPQSCKILIIMRMLSGV